MTHYLTKEGLAELEAELKNINEVEIPSVLDSINRAMSEGDLRENAALDSSKLEQDKLLTRQNEIEDVLNNYQIIDDSQKGSESKIVVIGNTVKVLYTDSKKEFILRIVGSSEANAIENKISNESPLAQVILGKKKNDVASLKTKLGKIEVKIIEIIS